jgi:hypothetical protein
MWYFDGFEPINSDIDESFNESLNVRFEQRLIDHPNHLHSSPSFWDDALAESSPPFQLGRGIALIPGGSDDDSSMLKLTSASSESDEGEIVVIGYRFSYEAGGGGGGYGLGDLKNPAASPRNPQEDYTISTNTDFIIPNDDAACQDGAAVNASEAIEGLLGAEGNFEFVGLLVENGDGTFGLSQNEVSTLYDTLNSAFDALSDYSSAYGVVHNHAFNDSNYNENFLNRYPSSGDWDALDILVQGGADPNSLSLFIRDPFGVLREFSYSQKALYEGMTDQERYNGENLPEETQGCS